MEILTIKNSRGEPIPETAIAYSVRTVSECLDCHDSTVRRWVASGQLPATKMGALLRIRLVDLEDFIHANLGRIPTARSAVKNGVTIGRSTAPDEPDEPEWIDDSDEPIPF